MRIFHALVQKQYCTVEPQIVHPSSLATAMIAFLCLPTFLPKWKLIFNVSIIHREGFKDWDLFAQIQCLPHRSLSADGSHEILASQGRVLSHSYAAQGMNQHQVNTCHLGTSPVTLLNI